MKPLSKYFKSNSDSDEYISSSSEESYSHKSQSLKKKVISENFDKIINLVKPPKKLIHKRDIKLWNTLVQGWNYLESPINWEKLLGEILDLCYWIKNNPSKEFIGSISPVILRILYYTSSIVDTLIQNKNYYKKELNKKEAKHFLSLSKIINDIKSEYSEAFNTFLKYNWPFSDTPNIIIFRFEECLFSGLSGLLSLRDLGLYKFPEELIHFDKILHYFAQFINSKEANTFTSTSIEAIDLSFNKISSISDPRNKLKQFSNLKYLNLYSNSIEYMPSTLLSAPDLVSLVGGKFYPTKYSKHNFKKLELQKIAVQPSRLLPSLSRLVFHEFFEKSDSKDWEILPPRLRTLFENAAICEGCSNVFIDLKRNLNNENFISFNDTTGLASHSSYIEDYFFKWDSKDIFPDGVKSEFTLTLFSLKRYFCFNCFWVHCRNVTLTRSPDQPICSCITCTKSRLRPIDSNFSFYPLIGLTNNSLTFLNQVLSSLTP